MSLVIRTRQRARDDDIIVEDSAVDCTQAVGTNQKRIDDKASASNSDDNGTDYLLKSQA